jgi:hypothetical protein
VDIGHWIMASVKSRVGNVDTVHLPVKKRISKLKSGLRKDFDGPFSLIRMSGVCEPYKL